MTVKREMEELKTTMRDIIELFWKAYRSYPDEAEKVILELKTKIEELIWDLQATFFNLVAISHDPDKYPIRVRVPPRIKLS